MIAANDIKLICRKCGKELPLGCYSTQSKTMCSFCVSERNSLRHKNSYKSKRKTDAQIVANGEKYCCACGEKKPIECFYKARHEKSGYRGACILCIRERDNNSRKIHNHNTIFAN